MIWQQAMVAIAARQSVSWSVRITCLTSSRKASAATLRRLIAIPIHSLRRFDTKASQGLGLYRTFHIK